MRETRRERAIKLLNRLQQGPSCVKEEGIENVYRLWVSSWIIPELVGQSGLIREIKDVVSMDCTSARQSWNKKGELESDDD